MKILAIDTSGQQAGAAVAENGKTLGRTVAAAHTHPKEWRHSQILLPAIARLLNEAGLTLADIGCIAYTCGPGSFTGLRIGAATALGLAKGSGLPCVGVPTLDAMAYTKITSGETKVVPVMDARRGQVYAAVYKRDADGKMERVSDYFAAPIEEVTEIAGDAVIVNDAVDPAAVAAWAMENINPKPNEPDNAMPIQNAELLYIRAPQAVREATGKC
ncbi:MAG: tRNA (adenosine(37)-N6)-threonylcarbamoyltransferase complex dimerization subunit type 1 TsaB [Defluviitaleaceae bacterium]|nr:tRNA (adenosine(37)-N6)-threonylcarbamoyltransferase complex dimerization subunit type 1 TsaB [Defluviitaleaceae bacterium]